MGVGPFTQIERKGDYLSDSNDVEKQTRHWAALHTAD